MAPYDVLLPEGTILKLNKETTVLLAESEEFLPEDAHIRLVNSDGELMGKGYVVSCQILPFQELSDADVAAIDNPNMRDIGSITYELLALDSSFDEDDDVMYLTFITDYIESASVYVDPASDDREWENE